MRSDLSTGLAALGLVTSLLLPNAGMAFNSWPDPVGKDGNFAYWSETNVFPINNRPTAELACIRHASIYTGVPMFYEYLSGTKVRCDYLRGNGVISELVITKYCGETKDGQHTESRCSFADDHFPQCLVTAGNPIIISDGIKVETAIDWVSPKDSRFRLERNYRADSAMNTSPVIESYNGTWGAPWDVQLTEQGVDELLAQRANGARYLFTGLQGAGADAMSPYRLGHSYELLPSHTSGRRLLTDGSGRQEFYIDLGTENKLDEIRWRDGYAITIARDVNNRVDKISDSRGQVAQFYWSDTLNPNFTVPVVTRIEVDLDFDGVVFSPKVALNYSYSVDTINKYKLTIDAVTRTDLLQSTTEEIWVYEYSSDESLGSPLKLTSIRDGRVDTNGTPSPLRPFRMTQRNMIHTPNIFPRVGPTGHNISAVLIELILSFLQMELLLRPMLWVKKPASHLKR